MNNIKRSTISIVVTVVGAGAMLLYSACTYNNTIPSTQYSHICVNGTPAEHATSVSNGTTRCISCDSGYILFGKKCVEDLVKPTEFISVQFAGTDTEIQEVVTEAPIGEERTIELTVDPSNTTLSSLFFQFTNTNKLASGTPRVRLSSGANNIVQSTGQWSEHANADTPARSYSRALQRGTSAIDPPIPLPIHIPIPPQPIPSQIKASTNGSALSLSAASERAASSYAATAKSAPIAPGDGRLFYLHQVGESATLYARAVRTVGEWSVVVWVHPDVYEGCDSELCLTHLLSQSDIDAIMDAFFKEGSNNDIFDWTTALTGPPWGDHRFDSPEAGPFQQISGATRTINIILTDIDRAGYTTPAIVGYFAYSDPRQSSHNQALTLFLHAPWAKFDTPNPSRQEGYYYYFISALAHEFQHLVHYYQRYVQLNVNDPIWLNEQYSLMIEDIVSQNIIGTNTNGLDDRGVNGLSAGSYPICNGRLPDYTEQSYYGITRWGGSKIDNEPLVNYAVNYSFGNFLLRNYNGVEYLVNSYSHRGDAIATVEAGLGGDSFADAVVKWGTAILLSDATDAPAGYRVNNGDSGFTYAHNGVSYAFGSTNYFNYGAVRSFGGCNLGHTSGVFAVSNNTDRISYFLDDEQHGHSNIFHEAGTAVSGTVKYIITLPVGSRLSVIAKRNTHAHNPVYF